MQDIGAAKASVSDAQGTSKSTFNVDWSSKYVDECMAEIEKDADVQQCVKESEFWLFAAICVEKSGVLNDTPKSCLHDFGLKVLAILQKVPAFPDKIKAQKEAVEGIRASLDSLPRHKRSKVIAEAIRDGRLYFVDAAEKLKKLGAQVETIEDCTTAEAGREYALGLNKVIKSSAVASNVSHFPPAVDVELEVWRCWSFYEACLKRFTEYGMDFDEAVTALRSLEECISACTFLHEWAQMNTQARTSNTVPVAANKPSRINEESSGISAGDSGCASFDGAQLSSLGSSSDAKLLLFPSRMSQPEADVLVAKNVPGGTTAIETKGATAAAEEQLGNGVSSNQAPSEIQDLVNSLLQQMEKLQREKETYQRHLVVMSRQCNELGQELRQTKADLEIAEHKLERMQKEKPSGETVENQKEKGREPKSIQSGSVAAPSSTESDVTGAATASKAPKEDEDRKPSAAFTADDAGKSKLVGIPLPKALIRYETEEITDTRRPSEMAKRFDDLFNHSYGMYECLEEILKDERECNKFTLDFLTTAHRAAVMNLTRVGEELVQVADLHGYVDNISAKKTIQECAVALCKLSNHLEGQSCSWIWQKAVSFQKWRTPKTSGAMLKSADAFLEKCIQVCWDLVLQKRLLLLVTDHKVFKSSRHDRFFGSDETSNDIDQFVWPCLVEEGTNRVLVKGKVITKKRGVRRPQKCK